VAAALEQLSRAEHRPCEVLRAYARRLAGWLEGSAFRNGSPITTTLLELSPQQPGVTAAGREAIRSWISVFAIVLTDAGIADERARRLATLTVAALEGALVQARVEQGAGPVLTTADELAVLFDAAWHEAHGLDWSRTAAPSAHG
jgi:TetR/AcrR family transcriptional regulator, lmrAB and yxaGH operons repressor